MHLIADDGADPRLASKGPIVRIGTTRYSRCDQTEVGRIDFSVLRDLTDQDLKDLGVVLGDRRKPTTQGWRAFSDVFMPADKSAQPSPPERPSSSSA